MLFAIIFLYLLQVINCLLSPSFMLEGASNIPNSYVSRVPNRRRRRPAGTPDPEAEVIALSPKTLMESDRYVCEICNQGFQRDQNLQMHRRRHKVQWKLVRRESPGTTNRVFVCPEPTCLHHHPDHALGDLVGIKKHFRRKHSSSRPWVCHRCSKGYAVQSDYKAHVRTCGSHGHSCHCGRVFSRVESFIEHQEACAISSSRAPSSSMNSIFSTISAPPTPPPCAADDRSHHDLEPGLLASSSSENFKLKLSVGPHSSTASKKLNLAMAEMGLAEEARRQARQQIELAELEFANAERIRQQALDELEKARILRHKFTKKISTSIMEITCHACKHKSQTTPSLAEDETSLALSYVSSATNVSECDD